MNLHYTKFTKKRNAVGLYSALFSSFSSKIPKSRLLYLSKNNSIESRDKLNTFTNAHKRSSCALAWNVEELVKKHGIEKIGFMTLTFKDNITCHKEAQGFFNSFSTNYLRKNFSGYIAVKERQKRGAWHYHILVVLDKDIKTNFDFSQVAKGNYTSASPYLSRVWRDLREACELYGFGRSELMPIRTNELGISRYIGKYLRKHIEHRKEEDKGVRLVNYGGVARYATSKFSWVTEGAKTWRAKLAHFALLLSLKNNRLFQSFDDFKAHLGSSWCYRIKDFLYFSALGAFTYKKADLIDYLRAKIPIKCKYKFDSGGFCFFDYNQSDTLHSLLDEYHKVTACA